MQHSTRVFRIFNGACFLKCCYGRTFLPVEAFLLPVGVGQLKQNHILIGVILKELGRFNPPKPCKLTLSIVLNIYVVDLYRCYNFILNRNAFTDCFNFKILIYVFLRDIQGIVYTIWNISFN